MKTEEKQRDIEKHLLSLSVKENVLDKREISERIQKLRSSIPRLARSALDLEVQMEDLVGLASVRRVKNLVSLTGKFKEDTEEK